MKESDLATVLAGLGIALSLGFAGDLTQTEGSATATKSDPPGMIEASIFNDPTGSRYQSEWNVEGSQGGVLPPSKDANPDQ
jgi:hypothetical protein